jgi:hypothetical protein
MEADFLSYQREDDCAEFEREVMSKVIPVICGGADIHHQQDVLFTEFEPLIATEAPRLKPDLFDEEVLQKIDKRIRDKDDPHSLYQTIIPTKHASVPVAPNFFVEAKARHGNNAVMLRQACYDGAHGARTMQSLQNYGSENPICDGNAYGFSNLPSRRNEDFRTPRHSGEWWTA